MRILHVIPSMSAAWGGPVSVVAGLIDSLASRGIESDIFTTNLGRSDDVVEPGAVRFETVSTDRLSKFWTAHSASSGSALNVAVQLCDVVHIHELWHHPHYQAHRAARRHGRPFVISPHGELDPWALGHKRWKKSIYMSLVQKRVLRRASAVHALTAEEARQTSLIAPDTPCNIVPNGIDVTALNSQASDADMFPQLADKKVILFLGRLHEKKGLDILVKAISIVRNTHPNLALLIAGDSLDNYGDRVRGFVVDEGIGDITTFTGLLSRKAVADAYAVARVFALPSRSEGFPMAVLEALASGVPVVITPECYFPEVAESGAGVEVEGTAPAFAKAITQLLANDDQRSKMAENARALVSKRFTVGAIAARMTAMYESVMTN